MLPGPDVTEGQNSNIRENKGFSWGHKHAVQQTVGRNYSLALVLNNMEEVSMNAGDILVTTDNQQNCNWAGQALRGWKNNIFPALLAYQFYYLFISVLLCFFHTPLFLFLCILSYFLLFQPSWIPPQNADFIAFYWGHVWNGGFWFQASAKAPLSKCMSVRKH